MADDSVRCETLTNWKEKDPFTQYLNSPFKKAGSVTEALLKKELRMIEARDVTLHTFHSKASRRMGGDWPRVDRAPSHPGVIVTFEKPGPDGTGWTTLRFPCNTYSRWEDNLRAIALALEALRKVDRYGVTTGAQYAGYKALPPGPTGPQAVPAMTPQEAGEWIVNVSGLNADHWTPAMMVEDTDAAEFIYKTAAKKVHPDKDGGSAEEFGKLETAMRIVREYQKGT